MTASIYGAPFFFAHSSIFTNSKKRIRPYTAAAKASRRVHRISSPIESRPGARALARMIFSFQNETRETYAWSAIWLDLISIWRVPVRVKCIIARQTRFCSVSNRTRRPPAVRPDFPKPCVVCGRGGIFGLGPPAEPTLRWWCGAHWWPSNESIAHSIRLASLANQGATDDQSEHSATA